MQPTVAQSGEERWGREKVGKNAMMDAATIAQMERELADARDQLLREDGQRYRILMREISEAEKERVQGSLTDRHERILFGLEPGAGRAGERPAKSGGTLSCSLCGKTGLTELGLKLHTTRVHKGDKGKAAAPAGG
jgi:hypothetical protein